MLIISLLFLLVAAGAVLWGLIDGKRMDFHVMALFAVTYILFAFPDANPPMRMSFLLRVMNSLEGIIAYAVLSIMTIVYEYIRYKEHRHKLPMIAIVTAIACFILLVIQARQ